MAILPFPCYFFKGMTNTELKRQYGSNHFNTLIRYESNAQRLMRCLYLYAKALHEAGYPLEASQVCSLAIQHGSEIKAQHRLFDQIQKERAT